jgi:hypothetical protein
VDLFEANTHVFILRFWLEPREIEGAEPEWRGVIEHVESGERRYFRNLEVMLSFVAKYFDGLDTEMNKQ